MDPQDNNNPRSAAAVPSFRPGEGPRREHTPVKARKDLLLLVFSLFLALPAGAAPPGEGPWAPHQEGRALHRCLVATRRIRARRDRPARQVHVWFLVPQNEPGQVVENLRYQPEPKEIITDKFGRKIAHFYFPEIPAGGRAVARWAARISTAPVRFLTAPKNRSPKVKAGPEIRRLYLADGPYYGIHSPYIQKIAAEIRGKEKDPARLVRRIALYLQAHLSYEMIGGWDKAEVVLKRGTGSCSEYTYSFIALCRAMGIPARFVGATMLRRRDGPSFDRAHHRWAEAFLEGYGWVQADPLRRDCLGRRSFTISSPRCVLGHGDGGEEPMGWKYTSMVRAKGRPYISEEYFWCEDPGKKSFRRVLDLGAGKPGKKRALESKVKALAGIGEGLCVPFLADSLASRDQAARAEAARAICRISTRAARDIRYRFRRSGRIWDLFSRALAKALGRTGRAKAGTWVFLFPWKGASPGRKALGPFKAKKGLLTNSGRDGEALFPMVTSDRYLVDLTFRTGGAGECALLLAHDGRDRFLRLPFFPPDSPLRKRNYLQGTSTSCRRGLYGVEPGRFHRAVVAVDRWKASFYLDGKKVFDQSDPAVGLGRIGLSAWGGRTTFSIRRLRVLEVPPDKDLADFLEDPGLGLDRK